MRSYIARLNGLRPCVFFPPGKLVETCPPLGVDPWAVVLMPEAYSLTPYGSTSEAHTPLSPICLSLPMHASLPIEGGGQEAGGEAYRGGKAHRRRKPLCAPMSDLPGTPPSPPFPPFTYPPRATPSALYAVLREAMGGPIPVAWTLPLTAGDLLWVAILLVMRAKLSFEEVETLVRLGGAGALAGPARRAASGLSPLEREHFEAELRRHHIPMRSWLWEAPFEGEEERPLAGEELVEDEGRGEGRGGLT